MPDSSSNSSIRGQYRYPLTSLSPINSNSLLQSNQQGSRDNLSWIIFRQIETEINLSSASIENTGSREVGRVELYLPGNSSVTDNVDYSQSSLGSLGSAIKRGLDKSDGSSGIGAQISKTAQSGLETADSMLDALTGGNVSTSAVAKILSLSRRVSPGISAGISSGIRAVANPHIQSVFNGVGIREFTFTFNLVPESREESKECRDIIRFFRRAVYPSFGALSNQDGLFDDFDPDRRRNSNEPAEVDLENQVAYTFPNVFDIRVQRYDMSSDKWIRDITHRFLRCHLTSVSTNFDPNETQVVRPDGSFSEYTLALSFQEERTLSQHDIDQGY